MVGALLVLLTGRAQAQTGNISFSDDKTRTLCVEAWETNGDGQLSYAEAAAVTDLGQVFRASTITSFDELRYFTSLTTIASEAFRNCESLRRIQFPQSVVSIGSNAFHTCRVLKSVVLNEGLTTVGSGAFIACLGLEELAFPSTVTTLEINVFYGCSSLRTVTLPEGITALPAGLFSGCSSLSSITVPYSVTTITSTTFRGCTSLTQVTMPVTLSADYLPQSVSVLHLVYRPEAEYTMLCSPNHLDFGMMDDITVYVVPSFEDRHVELTQVTDVAAGTGMLVHAQPGQRYEVLRSTTGELAPGQQSVHRVQQRWLGDAVTDSLSHANDGLLDLYTGPNFLVGTSSSITIPGLQDKKQNFILSQKDGRFLFSAITPAATIDAHSAYLQLPYDEVVGVADLVFPSDTAFTADNIFFADAEVKRVCVEAWDTDGDGELSFDEAAAVKSLGTRFKDNKSVKTFNELRHFTSLTQISNEAFYGCSSLTSVMLPPLLRTIGTNAFYGCFVLNAPDFGTHLVAISKGAFTSCTNFRSVSLPSTVRTIGPNAFYYCTGLTEVNIPEGVTEIGENTFSNCRLLPSIKLPNSLTTLRASAFNNTPNLTAVAMPAHIDAALLPKGVTDISLTVKMDAAYATLSSPNSLDFSGDENIKAYTASNLRGTNVYLNQVSDVPAATGIVIHGTAGTEYVVGLGTGAPLKEQNLLVAVTDTVTLEPDTTGTYTDLTLKVLGINVSFEAVNKTTNPRLWTAYLHLDAAQAAGNTSLRANFVNVGNIHFADPVVEQICLEHWDSDADGMLSYDEAAAVTDLGELFKGDTRIRSFMELEYFTGLEHIADSAFCACQNLAAVMLPQGLKTVGRHAFASCYAITEMDLPYSVTSIGTGAFRVCTRLEKVTLPDDAVDLGERLFDYCTHLTTVHLPENLTAIPANMFVNCKRLKSIYIPRYVESVGVSAFYGCPELTTVKKPAVLPDTNIPDVPDMQYYHILSGDWEAFSCPNAVDFTHAENVTAYAVDSYDDGVTYLRQLGDVAAGTGILLHGAYDTEAVFTKGQATEAEPNLLIGAVDSVEVWPTWVDKSYFLFSANTYGVGFVPVTDTVFTAPHSAYLAVPIEAAGFEMLQMVAGDIIVFADSYVKEICVGMWDTDGDGELSTAEAAVVSEVDVFSSNHDIRYFDELKHFTGVEELGVAAFRNCASLRRITIPSHVRVIGDFAFDGCYELNNIIFTEGQLERIGAHAFSLCTSLQQVELPSTVTELGESAFYYCISLARVNIPDGVREICPTTFASCTELQSIYIPCSVKTADESAFIDCFSLTTATLPATLALNLPGTVRKTTYIHRLEEEFETFCSPYNLVFPRDGVLAFTSPLCDGYRINLQRVDSLNAGTGVLLHGEVGRVYTLIPGQEATRPFNLYVGVLDDTELLPEMNNKYVFVLKNSSNGFGFYRVQEPTELGACRAYLPLDMSLVGYNDFLEIGLLPDIDDPVIQAPQHRAVAGVDGEGVSAAGTDEWFTLTGVRLPTRPVQPGLYIHNGRKEAVR